MRGSRDIQPRYDAIVIGARVAGAATAMLLARGGMRVLAIDGSAEGSDTLSTHAMMRAGVMLLDRWGVLDRLLAAGTPKIRRTTFHYGAEKIPVDIRERDGIDSLIAPRRTVLDGALAAAAREAGATVLHRTIMTELLRDSSGKVFGVEIRDRDGRHHRVEADIVIGADGARSSMAKSVGAEILRQGLHPAAFIYGYWRGIELDGTHWQYALNTASGALPTNDGLACVFVGMPPDRYRPERIEKLYNEVLAEVDPDLAASIARAERVGGYYPFAGRPGFIRQSWGDGWALVGDAACFKDPLTAHGMTDALRDAELLSRAVLDGHPTALAEYQRERDDYAVEFLDLSDEIASFGWDLDHLKSLHMRLSRLMNTECDLIRELYAPTAALASV